MGRLGKKLISALPNLWVTKTVNGEPVSKPQRLGPGELSVFFAGQFNSDKKQPSLRHNELTLMAELHGETIPVKEAELLYVQVSKKGGDISQKHAQDALRDAALDHSFDPVKDYLISVRDNPDIEPADIHKLATRFLGLNDNLANHQLAVNAIGAVRRVFEPGCKHDTVCIIHSIGQGKKKSTFWEMLASRPFFNDSAQTSDKDFLLNTHKCWLYELAEIESVTTVKGIAALKGVLSNAVDNFRPPYGAAIEEHPRRSIYVGTVNKTDFLRDPTGTRRFHVVPLPEGHRIPFGELENGGRDSFWKAAVLAYKRGDKNWLSDELEGLSEARNRGFREELIYESRFTAWLAGGVDYQGTPWDGKPFTTDDILHRSGCRDRSAIEQRHKNYATEALRSIGGFEFKQVRVARMQIWMWVPLSHDPCHMTSENLSEKAGQKNDEGLDPSCDNTHGAA